MLEPSTSSNSSNSSNRAASLFCCVRLKRDGKLADISIAKEEAAFNNLQTAIHNRSKKTPDAVRRTVDRFLSLMVADDGDPSYPLLFAAPLHAENTNGKAPASEDTATHGSNHAVSPDVASSDSDVKRYLPSFTTQQLLSRRSSDHFHAQHQGYRGSFQVRAPHAPPSLSAPLCDEDMVVAAAQLNILLSIYQAELQSSRTTVQEQGHSQPQQPVHHHQHDQHHPGGPQRLRLTLDIGGNGIRSPNAIGAKGISALTEVILRYNALLHVERLRCHACQLEDAGLRALLPLIGDTQVPPNEVHLSHNGITTAGALDLFRVVLKRINGNAPPSTPATTRAGNRGSAREKEPELKEREASVKKPTHADDEWTPVGRRRPSPFPKSGSQTYPFLSRTTRRFVPLWLRIEYNQIDVATIDSFVAKHGITVCTEMDKRRCSARECSQMPNAADASAAAEHVRRLQEQEREREHTASSSHRRTDLIHVHLPFYQYQTVGLREFLSKRRMKGVGVPLPGRAISVAAHNVDQSSTAALLSNGTIQPPTATRPKRLDAPCPDVAAELSTLMQQKLSIAVNNADRAQSTNAEAISPANDEDTLVLLDTNALIFLLDRDQYLNIATLLKAPQLYRGVFQFALCHTVGAELDGLKKGPHRAVINAFLRDGGLKQQCLDTGLLVEFSREEAEADLLVAGQVTSTHLDYNDSMIVNVARHIRKTIMMLAKEEEEEEEEEGEEGEGEREGNDASKDPLKETSAGDDGDDDDSDEDEDDADGGGKENAAMSAVPVAENAQFDKEGNPTNSQANPFSLLLLTGDVNMGREAKKIGVPSCTVSEFVTAVRAASLPPSDSTQGAAANARQLLFWNHLPSARETAQQTASDVMAPSAVDQEKHIGDTLRAILSWLQWTQKASTFLTSASTSNLAKNDQKEQENGTGCDDSGDDEPSRRDTGASSSSSSNSSADLLPETLQALQKGAEQLTDIARVIKATETMLEDNAQQRKLIVRGNTPQRQQSQARTPYRTTGDSPHHSPFHQHRFQDQGQWQGVPSKTPRWHAHPAREGSHSNHSHNNHSHSNHSSPYPLEFTSPRMSPGDKKKKKKPQHQQQQQHPQRQDGRKHGNNSNNNSSNSNDGRKQRVSQAKRHAKKGKKKG